MKRMILLAGLLVTVAQAATPASAMDDAERARQMEVYQAHQTTGTGIVTKTTTVEAATDTGAEAQMAPLTDSGQPMTNVEPKAETLGAVDAQADSDMKSERERQLEAYEAWKAGQTPAVTSTQPATPVAAPAQNAPAVPTVSAVQMNAETAAVPADTMVQTGTVEIPGDTTTEKTTTTTYTVTTRKVGMVGNRPYPAKTNEMAGGVTKQISVNGTPTATQVITPDAVAPLKDQVPEGDYYANPQGVKEYRGTVGTVRVHNTGRMNR